MKQQHWFLSISLSSQELRAPLLFQLGSTGPHSNSALVKSQESG